MKIGKYEIRWSQLLAIAVTILFLYMVLTRIFGHSATDFSLVLTAFGTLGTWIINLESRFSTINREIGEFKTSMLHFRNEVMEKLEVK